MLRQTATSSCVSSAATATAAAAAGAVGEPTAASNTLTLIWDEDAPQPVIGTAGKYSSTDNRRVPLLIDFGERVAAMNPLDLFKTEGFGRWADALRVLMRCACV